MAAICHTINPRLFPEQISYIVNHADDRFIFFDVTFVKLVEAFDPRTAPVSRAGSSCAPRNEIPDNTIPGLLCYEELVAGQSDDFTWPEFDENTASSLCYTSGTTGNPKGVLYSHRSTVLHAYGACLPDALGASARDCILPVVPMFHVNAWGLPYACALTGAKLVMPGPHLDGASLYSMFEEERRHHVRRGADHLARLAAAPAGQQAQAIHRQAPGDRRLGGAAGDDPRLR
jgi:acyl-CoA synthetase (AMP-forming)/AMP-acid ligase II